MMDPDYDLFVMIVDAKSLSAAARALRLSPASLTKRLQRLEARLGVRLVHRTTRRMALTPQGEALYHDLLAIKAALSAAEARASGHTDIAAGPLRMSAPTSFGRIYLGPCIAAFVAANPRIDLELNLSDGFVDLMDGRYDLAIRIAPQPPQTMVARRLGASPRVLCASPAYLAAHGTPDVLGDLRRHRLLAAEGQLPWRLSGPEGEVAHKGASIVQTNSSEMVRELTIAGAGISLRSLWDVSHELEAGTLMRVLPYYEGAREAAIYAVHTPAPRVPAPVRAMTDHLADWFSRHHHWELEGASAEAT
jgi:DNA-binding transcriptional LysR family regulator